MLSIAICAVTVLFNRQEIEDMVKEVSTDSIFSERTVLIILYITFIIPFLNTYMAYLAISGLIEDLFSKD